MKKVIFALVFTSFIFPSCFKKMAQSKAADPHDDYVMLKRDFNVDIINQLKATTTVFFYKPDNATQLDSLKEAVSAGWDLTPIVFDDIDNFDKYASDKNYSYFIIEGLTSTTSSGSGSYSNSHYYLTLRLFKDVSKKGKVLTNGLCRIELYPDFTTIEIGEHGGKKAKDIIEKLYKKGIFYNLRPVLLEVQLAAVETNIKNGTRPWLYQNIKSDNLSQILSEDTLYVPQSLLMTFNKFSGKEKSKSENPFSGYHYKYRICTDSDLFDIFVTQKRGRLLFEYVKSSTDKFISVYDLKSKNIIYRDYTSVSYNLKDKDVERIK